MTNRRQANNKGNNKQEKVVSKDNRPVQKDHQEAQLTKKDKFDERKQRLLDETQQYMYQQSSKFSSASRNLVLGIIGTIWVLTYTDSKLSIPNIWLLCSLVIGLLFLLVDVVHYFWDAISYQSETYKLEKYKDQIELDRKHEPQMDSINKRSHRFIVAKFCILMLASLSFAIGLFLKATLV